MKTLNKRGRERDDEGRMFHLQMLPCTMRLSDEDIHRCILSLQIRRPLSKSARVCEPHVNGIYRTESNMCMRHMPGITNSKTAVLILLQ